VSDRCAAVDSEVRVLVVDDDPVILRLLEVNFEMEGYAVLTASDGVQGLRAAREQRPHVIISDVMMPHMNGLELVAALDADEATGAIPVILLSARAQETDVSDGLQAGADDYVTKPFDPLELIDRVQQLLARP
jgi:DNA-binding response OmpR family regulator